MRLPVISRHAVVGTDEAAQWVGVAKNVLAARIAHTSIKRVVQLRVARGNTKTSKYKWADLRPLLEGWYGDAGKES